MNPIKKLILISLLLYSTFSIGRWYERRKYIGEMEQIARVLYYILMDDVFPHINTNQQVLMAHLKDQNGYQIEESTGGLGGIMADNIKIATYKCSYCNIEMNMPHVFLEDYKNKEIRTICVACLIKAFDKILEEK